MRQAGKEEIFYKNKRSEKIWWVDNVDSKYIALPVNANTALVMYITLMIKFP